MKTTTVEKCGSDELENSTSFDVMPNAVKRRVSALKKLHQKRNKIDERFVLEIIELQKKFESEYEPLYQKRYKIVTGIHEPLDSELSEDSYVKAIPSQVSGIPNFWLKVLLSFKEFIFFIKEYDEQILRHLMDVRISCDTHLKKYSLEFHFSPNDYFTNEVLIKEMYFSLDPQEVEILLPIRSVSSRIHWKDGKDVTIEPLGESSEEVLAFQEIESFFRFFWTSPTKKPMNGIQEISLANEWVILKKLMNDIIPNAGLIYTEAMAIELEKSSEAIELKKSSEVIELEKSSDEEELLSLLRAIAIEVINE